MRVLVCIPCLLTGGTEIQTLSLVEALITAGHQVEIVCYFEYEEGMVERYRETGATVRLLSPAGTRPKGVKAVSFLWKGLKSTVREFKPDVAHVQYMTPAALVVVILRALGVRKIMATTHTPADIYSITGLKIMCFLTRHVLIAMQCITKRAEKGYFGSSSVFNGRLHNHFTIYNCLPSHITLRDTPRPIKGKSESIIVGVVSRLEPIKGMDMVIPAFAQAVLNNSNLRLMVVGDGSLLESMKRQATEFEIEDRIKFKGRTAQSDLQQIYDSIDILLMPSRSEGFGLTAIEGMARGCVPVVADTGGLPEVVTMGSGLLHVSQDIEGLGRRILEAAQRKKLHSLSEGSRKRAALFSYEKYYEQIAKLYSLIK